MENSFRNWLIWFASTLQRPCKRKLAKLFASCPMWSRQSLPLPISRVLAQLWPQVCQVPQSRWSWCLTYTYFRVWLFMSLHNAAKVILKLFFIAKFSPKFHSFFGRCLHYLCFTQKKWYVLSPNISISIWHQLKGLLKLPLFCVKQRLFFKRLEFKNQLLKMDFMLILYF